MSAWTEFTTLLRRGFIRTTLWTSFLTGLFFVAYFAVQRHPSHAPVLMPVTALDALIPFAPVALLAYLTLWVYVGVGPGLQRSVREFAAYGAWLCGLCVSGLVIFYFWPTRVPPTAALANGFPGFSTLHRLDESGNACPSMHVAVAIFTVVRVDEVLRAMRLPLPLRVANAIWFALIVYSTLATKQHVVLDVIAGAVLGLIFAAMSLRWRPVFSRRPNLAPVALPS
ncbi:MAG TPA: phosphatase PAP2 family protein [Steroidobacteraceae bacterium]|nr:phosphatase PAP2 family protein [Steroidobacteraceae bacterium]